MTDDSRNAIHIVSGASAAGTLKQAHHLTSDQILISYDPLASGPIPATTDFELWRSVRDEYWSGINAEFTRVVNAPNDLNRNTDRLNSDYPIILWVATSLPDQLLAAWVAFLFDELQFDTANLSVVQVDYLRPKPNVVYLVRSIGQLSADRIRTELPQPRTLSVLELREYRDAWKTYTSDDPRHLKEHVTRDSKVPVLRKAMQRLIYRYPSYDSGLCACDEEMLKQTARTGPRAARVIGYTMGELMETEEFIGDGVLFHRLTGMGSESLASPLLAIKGDPHTMRACEVEITDFGRKVLSGEVNALEVNKADDWIGGVHISGLWPVPHRRDDELIIPN